jgi:predicted transcriptional regulator
MAPSPLRSVRIPDEVWLAALDVAAQRNETVSEVIRKALEKYVKRAN